MNAKKPFPTSYPEINSVLARLLVGVQGILSHLLTGLYLHGSLAYGDFNQQTSDIDFLVVTEDILPTRIFHALKIMHSALFNSGLAWSRKLEGAYLPLTELRRHDPDHNPLPWLGEDGHFALEKLGSDWILQRWILREKGIVVSGPPLKPMIDPISADTLRDAVRLSLREWWTPPFPSPQRFQNSEYQAYAILTMCRSLFVLEHGRIVSKPEAVRWALETLEEPWCALISAAANWKAGEEFDQMNGVIGLIDFTLNKCGFSTIGESGSIS